MKRNSLLKILYHDIQSGQELFLDTNCIQIIFYGSISNISTSAEQISKVHAAMCCYRYLAKTPGDHSLDRILEMIPSFDRIIDQCLSTIQSIDPISEKANKFDSPSYMVRGPFWPKFLVWLMKVLITCSQGLKT